MATAPNRTGDHDGSRRSGTRPIGPIAIHGSPAHLQGSPAHPQLPGKASAPPTEVSNSDSSSWMGNGVGKGEEVNYPTSAVEILDLLREGVAILSGGRDQQGQSIITIPAQHKNYVYQRDSLRRVVQYLACIPAVDVREFGFSVIVDARNSTWSSTKLILRTLQEALPGQIHIAYILQPGQFWQKQQSSRGHSKEKSKLEFTTIKLSSVEKLTRHVDSSQLTSDLGGFLPYKHDQWLSLRQDLEHLISLYSSLMEHSHHIEQQIHMEQESAESDSFEEQLKHHLPLQDMVKRAPQDAIRKGNDLLRSLERGRDESGTAMTPDKINAVATIKQMLEQINQRQAQLEELWKQRKTSLEQNMQVKSFERSVYKVRGWLKTRGEDMVVSQCDIGTSVDSVQAVLEHHEKCEAKARLQYNLLTQLRRSADRYSGELHFASENMQKQITKLGAKFSKFEGKMAARRSIIEGSLRLHTSLRQWKEQCEVVAQVLKQEGAESGEESGEVESQEQLVHQLRQVGDVVLEEAGSLMELMTAAARHPREGEESVSGRVSVPDYTTGMNHIRRLREEVENHRRRLGQLAEAKKVQAEQLKQIDSCEKDAKQETRWLEYMRTQLSSSHGDIGDSISAVDKLISEHSKFMETAKKSYKYGCGLISAAGKGRRSFQLETTSSSLLSSHTSSWEKLLSGAAEVADRLKMARHFHSLCEEVLNKFASWMKPLHELPKTPDLVEWILKDIAENREDILHKTKECLATGRSLYERLSRPVLPETDFTSLNDHVRVSRSFLEGKMEELERREGEVQDILPQQRELLNQFITYCQFERRIEKVLLWLQKSGLKKLPSFSVIGEDSTSLQQQQDMFDQFQLEATQLTEQVQELLGLADHVEAQITGFRSDLVKKASSLKAVWDKFLQRVGNRGMVLSGALAFYTAKEELSHMRSEFESALSPEAIRKGGGVAYLDHLTPSKDKYDELYRSAVQDGLGLVEIFNKPPIDPLNPVSKISDHLRDVEDWKRKVDAMWVESRGHARGSQDETLPPGDKATPTVAPNVAVSVVRTVSSGRGVDKVSQVVGKSTSEVKISDRFSELEEEAYECLEWLECQYETFILAHSDFHESPVEALALKDEYSKFINKLEPTCAKVDHVLSLMSQLRPQAPTLSSSIDQLCQVVSDRVKTLKGILGQCSDVLSTFAQFCDLYKGVDSGLQSVETMLWEDDIIAELGVEQAQDLLEHGTALIDKLKLEYEDAKGLGESFLNVTSEILCNRGGPKLAVGGACTSVAVDLGDLEGRGPELFSRWDKREKELVEIVGWHAFKLSSEQVCLWLRQSAALFLQNHTDIGTSLETAEDLLTEHQEFQARAERTAAEVSTLLDRSEAMQASGHPFSQQLRTITSQLQTLHSDFETRFANRKKLLESMIEFFSVAQELCTDMNIAIAKCQELSGKDLPSHLKIASISSRLKNLQHLGGQLYLSLASKPTTTAKRRSHVINRSDSTSASEVSIREQLSALQAHFSHYKEEFESRRLSQDAPQRAQMRVSPVSPVLVETRAGLKSPVQENGHAPKKARPMSMDHLGVEREERFHKTASLGRRSTLGVWWAGKIKRDLSGNAVKEKIAMLNEKSKEDTVPIQELGANYGQTRQRAKSVGSAIRRTQSGGGKAGSKAGVEGDESAMGRSKVAGGSEDAWEVDDELAIRLLRRRAKSVTKSASVITTTMMSRVAKVTAKSAEVGDDSAAVSLHKSAKVETKSSDESAAVSLRKSAKVETKSSDEPAAVSLRKSAKVEAKSSDESAAVPLRRKAKSEGVSDESAVVPLRRKAKIEAKSEGVSDESAAVPLRRKAKIEAKSEGVSDESAVVPLRRKAKSEGVSDESAVVPLRRRGKGLSKAERSQKIEDIKKLFETSELADHLGAGGAESAPTWSPREYDIKAPSSSEVGVAKREPEVASGRAMSVSKDITAPAITVSPPPTPPAAVATPTAAVVTPPEAVATHPYPSAVTTPSVAPEAVATPQTTPPQRKGTVIPRERLNTAPTIFRTVIKDRTPPARKQVITISMDTSPSNKSAVSAVPDPPTEDHSLDSKLIPSEPDRSLDSKLITPAQDSSLDSKLIPPIKRVTRSVSPTNRHRVNSVPTSPASPISVLSRKGNGRGLIKGKVSSLRDMFDSNSNSKALPDPGLVLVPPKPLSNSVTSQQVAMETKTTSTSDETTPDVALPTNHQDNNVATPTCIEATPTSDEVTPTSNEVAEITPPSEGTTPSSTEATPTIDEASNKEATPSELVPDNTVSVTINACDDSLELISGPEVEELSPDDIRHLKESSPSRPRLPSPSVLSPHYTPPPRPPPPLGYYDHSSSNTPNPEWDDSESSAASESGSSLLGESDMEWIEDELVEWDEDEDEVDFTGSGTDLPDSPRLRVPRPLKSLRAVLSDLLTSEQEYLRSLELLSEVYLVHSQTSTHVPSFLRGAETKIFAHLSDLYTFQRQFCEEISLHEDSVEGICNCFIANEAGFQVYGSFLLNSEQQGHRILAEYGGSFFTDKQREVEDEEGLSAHYAKPKARLVQYLEIMKDLSYCAQKQYLHGVSLVKDATKVMMRVLRSIDNAYGLSHLRGCPHDISDEYVICRDHFLVYSTRGKRKAHVMCVFLHPAWVVFARPRKERGVRKGGKAYLEFHTAMETSEMHLLETYKNQEDKFALCEGRLATDNLYVLQPTYQSMLIKGVWLQELWPVLQKRYVSRDALVSEAEMPLPLFFRSTEWSLPVVPRLEEQQSLHRSPSISRRLSFRRRRKERPSDVSRASSEVTTSEKREAMIRSSLISSGSSTTSSIPAPPLARISLASMSAQGQFIAAVESVGEEAYAVIEDFSSADPDFLTVKEGQRVEILDDSNIEVWLILTLPQAEGEKQEEGFVPRRCLHRVTASTRDSTATVSLEEVDGGTQGGSLESSPDKEDERVQEKCVDDDAKPQKGSLDEDSSNTTQEEKFEAETGQEVPQGTGSLEEEANTFQTTPTGDHPQASQEKPDNVVCSEETTGQDLSSPLHPLPPPDFSALTPSETSFTEDITPATQSLQTPPPSNESLQTPPPSNEEPAEDLPASGESRSSTPPHKDLLASSEQIGSDSSSSICGSCSPLPSLPPPPPIPDKQLQGYELSSSMHSLPTTFSPSSTPVMTPHKFLGYNPMMIPTLTMSQPNIPQIKIDPSCPPHRQRGELSQLQWANVEATPETSLEDFDPVEIHVAIADFVAIEESNISLRAGQCVQVLDCSRSDWWLVVCADSESQGWVPANYLEQRVIGGPSSPPPDPFEDEMGELASILMKNQSPSEIDLNRRELYRAPFLASPGHSPEEPTDAQLRGVFSIEMPYLAVTEVQADYPEQITVIKDQPVRILDSRRNDWWLISSIPEEGEEESLLPAEGWIQASLLRPDEIRENSVENIVSGSRSVRSGSIAGHPLARHSTVSPSEPAQWMVLADYTATEPGMLSVSEGELVELIETSSNEWCLVRSRTRPSMDGWVPMAYVCPCGSESFANHTPSPRGNSFSTSSSEESQTPTELSEQSFTMPPETIETYDDEDQRANSEEKRKCVLSELLKTEQDYVQKLHYCLLNYDPEVIGESAPRALRALRSTLLGNMEEIYAFHKEKLLPELMECESEPTHLGDVFIGHEQQLKLYIPYCRNKTASSDIYREFFSFFEELHAELKDRQKLPDYLILPVQRITKYGLLLADFHKYSVKAGLPAGEIERGVEVTRLISTQANNAIHLSMIEDGSRLSRFGELVLQDVFLSQEGHGQIYKERRVFLFEKGLVVTKRRFKEDTRQEEYYMKDQFMLRDVSVIQDMDRERRNLIVYDMVAGTRFILRAVKPAVRENWLSELSQLMQRAKLEKSKELASRIRSASEPAELARSFSFSRKSVFRREREDSKRKPRRPNSSSGVNPRAVGNVEMVPAGTEYVVMECIVMEGEDDHTLDPGEVVELVRDSPTDAPLLRVRTKEDIRLEGKIASSYLRRRDSIKGGNMESTPKFTMQPVDLDLPVGSVATISCAFNGYPAPVVVWKRDHENLVSDERRKIMSCATSSVLELSGLEYDDEGRYACFIANAIGEDCTTMTLSLHGPPSEPQKPVMSKVTSTSVKLKWSVPDMDGGVPILSYQIEMLQDGFDQWQPIVQQPRTYFVVKTLEPSTSYQFRVSAVNKYGFSAPSEPSDLVVTKGKGLLNTSPSFKKLPNSIEAKEDLLGVEDVSKDPFIRRGSVSSSYDILPEELGRGRFGIVHICHHRQSGMQCAAKFVRLRSRKKAFIRREAEILKKVRGKSPYILEFQEAYERGRNLIIITELVPSGELLEVVVRENNLTEAIAVSYLSQLLLAVETLHKLKVAHLDIRPENILLSFGRVKVIDFGTARDLAQAEPTPLFASSVEFCAPEVVNQDVPTLAADMWSLGVLTYVLLSGLSPFFAENIHTVVGKIKDARYSFNNDRFDSISQEAKEFISTLLQRSPEYRMQATAALQHPWIKMLGGIGERVRSPWLMAKLDISHLKSFIARRKWHTSTVAVDDTSVYGPRSMTCFSPTPPDFEELAKNEDPPRLSDGPSELTSQKGSCVTLQFSVSGSPLPSVTWEHDGVGEVKMSPRQHVVELSGGVTSLTISDLTCEDGGIYTCNAVNHLGSVSAACKLTVLVLPSAPTDVNTIILGSYNSALISWLPPVIDGNAPIAKYRMERQRLDFETWEEVSSEIEGAAHVVDDLLPGITYIFRVSAINQVGIGPASDPSEPVTIETSKEYDSDSPTLDQVRLKRLPFDLEYEEQEDIFKGQFCTVVRCKDKTTDYEFAAKVLSVEEEEEGQRRLGALEELDVLMELSHPRVVALEGAFDNEDRIIIVMEYLGGGTLREYVSSHTVLTDYSTTRFMKKLLEGLQYLHDCSLIHTNLIPDNILLSAGFGDLKIGGFGMARYVETGNQLTDLTSCGVEFLSPEAVSLQPLTTAVDIWSAGVIAFFMLTGKSPFQRASEEAVISAITSGQVDISGGKSSLSTEAQDFVSNCLGKNPRRRPAALQCQRHRWLSGGSRRSSAVGQSSPLGRRGSFGSSPTTRRRVSSGSDKGGEKKKSKSSPSRKPLSDNSHR